MAKRIIQFFLILLVFTSASEASAAAASIIMLQSSAANATRINQEKQKESNKVTCQPQAEPSAQLWTCKDAYGNEFKDLKIIQAPSKTPINTKRASQ